MNRPLPTIAPTPALSLAASVLLVTSLAAALAAPLAAQDAPRRFAFTLQVDSADLAEVSALVRSELSGPLDLGDVTGEFVSGTIYPFGGEGRWVVGGIVENPATDDAWWVLHPFGAGLDDAPSRVLGPATGEVEIRRIGDLFGTGNVAVYLCDRRTTASPGPVLLEFDGEWIRRDTRVPHTIGHCGGR